MDVVIIIPVSQVWNLANCKLKTNHIGHTGFLNTVTVSPDGSLCASGGKVILVDFNFEVFTPKL